jgi:hypothetical protein
VERVVGVPQPEAPPSLPPAQIISAFTKKEDLYSAQRPLYSYKRTVRIQEFGPDGHPSGEFNATYQGVRASDGQFYEKAIAAPETSLQYLPFEPDDAHYLAAIPYYPLTTDQLSKYNVQFLSTEKVDEIDCYIFDVRPKTLDRKHPYFEGIIWVDQKYLEVPFTQAACPSACSKPIAKTSTANTGSPTTRAPMTSTRQKTATSPSA